MSIANTVKNGFAGAVSIFFNSLAAGGYLAGGAANLIKATAQPIVEIASHTMEGTAELAKLSAKPVAGILSTPFALANDYICAPLVRVGKTFKRAVDIKMDKIDAWLIGPEKLLPVLIKV